MNEALDKCKLFLWIAIVSLLIASLAMFLWGAVKTVMVIAKLIETYGKDFMASMLFIELTVIFLIATFLLVLAVGIHELFIGELVVPEWLAIRNFQDFMNKIGSFAIVIMIIVFLKHIIEWRDPQGAFHYGIGIALIAATLAGLNRFLGKE
jgi:uncharacterized membrane protein YqhA